jgi:RHS repeat-associated protein
LAWIANRLRERRRVRRALPRRQGSRERNHGRREAGAHAGTPTTAHLETLGRTFLTLADNGPDPARPDKHLLFATRVELDIEGNQHAVRDAVVQAGDPLGRTVMRYDYDMLGNCIHQASMEAGLRWMLNDAAGKPIRAWDSRGHGFRTEYDPLRRPLRSFLSGIDINNPNSELLTERLVYGEQHPQAEQRNLRGKLHLHLDQAGAVTSEAHDFKGNLQRASRRLTNGTQYRQTIDWRALDDNHAALPSNATAKIDLAKLEAALGPRLEIDTYKCRTTYDAFNRPIQLVAPHKDQPGTKINVVQPIYNEANLLEQVHAWLNHTAEPVGLLDPGTADLHAVTDIDYDAKGQRTLIEYGSGATPVRKGVTTTYTYDPLTFRLTHLLTRRNAAAFPDDCPQQPPPDWPGCQVQNLHYSYDPAGNITHIRDDAQQTIYFKNQRVEPSNDYTYDALHRLIEAKGREHLGLTAAGAPNTPIPHSYNDSGRVGVLSADGVGHFAPNDGKAMGTYTERYVYDAVGNFISMQHRGSNPVHPGWTRGYAYNKTSLIEDGTGGTLLKTSNRLSSTTVGSGTLVSEPYDYDPHGNMLGMPQLQEMRWDYKDQPRMTCRQKVNDQDTEGAERHGERTWYVYDAAGQRVRKVNELANNGGPKEERIYLGGFEIYRRHSGPNAGLVRETLHIMDDKQRIALVETRNDVNDGTAKQLSRYQFGNHLGSASLELDAQAQIISYEEYTPYGSTSYQAVRSKTEMPKRYRYTGKERDEESGLYYHGARYYAPWLGRWTSCDPIGISGSINQFVYADCRPLVEIDQNGMWGIVAVIGVAVTVAVILVTIEHPANAPSTVDVKKGNVEPRPALREDLAKAAVVAASGGGGAATGKAVATEVGGQVLGPIVGGAAAGGTAGAWNAVGQQAIADKKRGQRSSLGTYLKRAGTEGAAGMVLGGGLAAAGVGAQKVASLAKPSSAAPPLKGTPEPAAPAPTVEQPPVSEPSIGSPPPPSTAPTVGLPPPKSDALATLPRARFASRKLEIEHGAKHGAGVIVKNPANPRPKSGGADVPEGRTISQYRTIARYFFSGHPEGVEDVLISGEHLRYDPKTGYFGILSKEGNVRTLFRPDRGRDYFVEEVQKRLNQVALPKSK